MRILITLCVFIFGINSAIAQCDFFDDYSNSVLWTQVGSNVEVSSNALQFINGASNGDQRRVYRSLGTTLNSSNHFIARFEFKPASVGSQNGQPSVGHRLLALTAGTQEPFNNCPDIPCTGLPTGNQDGIIVLFLSRNPSDGDLFFLLKAKDGTNEYTSSTNIPVLSLNLSYYIELSRMSSEIVRLSVFSDTSYLNHVPGSPIFDTIPSSVTNLTTVQHCNAVRGISQRELTGTIDNLCIDFNDYTGIHNTKYNEFDVKIFPNPSVGNVEIIFDTYVTGEIEVLNTTGQQVFKTKFEQQNKLQLALPRLLERGLYIINACTQNGTYSKQLVLN